MEDTLTELCQELRNWFDRERYIGQIELTDSGGVYCNGNAIPLADNQYFRVIGSVFSDGVHKYPEALHETFEGAVWTMAIPTAFISLAKEIEDWNKNIRPKLLGPFSAENLSSSGYSYQKMSASEMQKADYKTVFASRLNKWRKI